MKELDRMTKNVSAEFLAMMRDLSARGSEVAMLRGVDGASPILGGKFDDLWISFAEDFYEPGLHGAMIQSACGKTLTAPGISVKLHDHDGIRSFRVLENLPFQKNNRLSTNAAVRAEAAKHFVNAEAGNIGEVEKILLLATSKQDSLVGVTAAYFDAEFFQTHWGLDDELGHH